MNYAIRAHIPGAAIVRPTGRYNCHGLALASRRTNIPAANDPNSFYIKDLLARDHYQKRSGTPKPGDIVSYTSAKGEIVHTGIVVRIETVGVFPQVMVLSKWGGLGEYEHPVRACPDAADTTIDYWTLDP